MTALLYVCVEYSFDGLAADYAGTIDRNIWCIVCSTLDRASSQDKNILLLGVCCSVHS